MASFNWVTIPYFGGVGFVIGLAILIGVSLLALGSSIPVVGAGGLTSRERRARQSVLGRSVLITPLVCVIALAFFIAPLKRPVNIILVSRSQPATLEKAQADGLADQ